MRIVLLHVPPIKMSSPQWNKIFQPDNPEKSEDPNNIDDYNLIPYSEPVIGDDFSIMPYGLFSIAAQAIHKGHKVQLYNVSQFEWSDIKRLVEKTEAQLFGMSCFTANRHGVNAASHLIKSIHRESYVVIGGPHATVLPKEILEEYRSVDAVVIGEGEETIMEIITYIENGKVLNGIPGTAWRKNGNIIIGSSRPRITDLDSLASPVEFFSLKMILTSRGCSWDCTFCASPSLWGRKTTYHSHEYVLKILERSVKRYEHPFIIIKDDTFTTNKKRAHAICRGIINRNLNLIWSCDTRIDCLDEDLLKAMRLAGCQQLSLGVESGSAKILKSINKKISPGKILETTRLAKKYGLRIRFYMIAGSRGETLETLRESIDLINKARPNQYIFAILSIFPGTEEYRILERNKKISVKDFFTNDFELLLACNAPSHDEQKQMLTTLHEQGVFNNLRDYSVHDYREVLKRLPDLNMAYLDLGGALLRDGCIDEAEYYINRAREMKCPEGFVLNYIACIAALKNDFDKMESSLEKAYQVYPHDIVIMNLKIVNKWKAQGGDTSGIAPSLNANHDFEVSMIKVQPELSGPIDLLE